MLGMPLPSQRPAIAPAAFSWYAIAVTLAGAASVALLP